MDVKFVEVDGQKFVDGGDGTPKLDDNGNPVPFIEEKTVPYGRFKEVNEEKNRLEQEIASLKNQKRDGGLSPEQEKELQAKQYLKSLLKETLAEEEKAKQEAEATELKQFEASVDEVLALNPAVKRDDFLKFIEEKSDEYGIQTPEGAMKLYLDLGKLSKDALDKAKDELRGKPKLPHHEGEGGSKQVDDTGKSLYQIASEAIANLKK